MKYSHIIRGVALILTVIVSAGCSGIGAAKYDGAWTGQPFHADKDAPFVADIDAQVDYVFSADAVELAGQRVEIIGRRIEHNDGEKTLVIVNEDNSEMGFMIISDDEMVMRTGGPISFLLKRNK